MTISARKAEELLETIYTQREKGRDDAGEVLAAAFAPHAPDATIADLHELAHEGFVRMEGSRVQLTRSGLTRAEDVVRRHRLAERLFRDLLDLAEQTTETHACEVEHILSVEATDAICTLLGHPPTCPHGKPIPRGACCTKPARDARPVVVALPELELGAIGRISFVAPRFHDRMDRLAALGVVPGCELKLHQRAPAFVVEVGETTIALDPEIAGEIYVKRRG